MHATTETPQERILKAAKHIFSSRGFRGGSLNDVAKLSGYTRAGLLHYYPSKESILLALLERRDEELGDLLPFTATPMSVFELLDAAEAAQSRLLSDRALVQLGHILTAEAAGGDHPAHEWVAARQSRVRGSIAAALEHSVETGELPSGIDIEALAVVLLAVAEGAESQWLLDEKVEPLRAHAAMRKLLEGLKQQTTR